MDHFSGRSQRQVDGVPESPETPGHFFLNSSEPGLSIDFLIRAKIILRSCFFDEDSIKNDHAHWNGFAILRC
jgi:hypothetical protein